MPTDKSPLVIKEFKGKLVTDADLVDTTLGEMDQVEIPFGYALDARDLDFLKKGGIRARYGIERYMSWGVMTGKPMQMWRIENLNGLPQTDRWMILTWDGATGRMYDSAPGALVNPIMSLAGMKYAYVINAFGRMYISPWEGWAKPLGDAAGGGANNWIWLYNGSYVARLAGCAEPVPGVFAVSAIAGGNCTPGLHLVSLIYETDSGYRSRPPTAHITAPLPVTTTAANATILFSNMPVGAAGTGITLKHVLVTKVVVNNNNQGFLSYEPFIAITEANAVVNSSFAGPDSALIDSAKDWVLSQDIIRSCVSMAVYGNRMVYLGLRNTGGATGNGEPNIHMIAVSRPNLPEQVNFPGLTLSTAGRNLIVVGQDYSGKVMNGAELNGTFYIFKEDSTHAFIADDTKDPVEWPKPTVVDGAKGAFPFGVAKVGNNLGNDIDGYILVAGNHGLSYFNGKFAQRSLMEAIWDEYKPAELKWAKVLVEPIRQLIFVRIGDPNLDNLPSPHSANREIFVGNYYFGTDITTLRWNKWRYLYKYDLTALLSVVDIDLREPITTGNVIPAGEFNSFFSLLCLLDRFADNSAEIYSEGVVDRDFYTAQGVNGKFPQWMYETGFTPNDSGEIYTFGPIKLRVRVHNGGVVGNVDPTITVEVCNFDSIVWRTIATFDPTSLPEKYYSINVNFYSERIRLRISGTNRATLDELILYRSKTAEDRPRV